MDKHKRVTKEMMMMMIIRTLSYGGRQGGGRQPEIKVA